MSDMASAMAGFGSGTDANGFFARQQAGGFTADPRFLSFAEDDEDDAPPPAATRGQRAAAAPEAQGFVPKPYGDGASATPGAAILALLDAAAQAAARQDTGSPRANRHEPMPDPVAEARADGYARGWADAQAAAAAERARQDAAHEAFRLGFTRLDKRLAAQSAGWLIETVAALCEATLAPLALDAKGLAARAARAVEVLAEAEGELAIRLNPEDHAMVAPLLPADWSFRPDPALARGVLAVAGSEGGLIDDPADWPATIRAAIAQAYPTLAGAAA